jgi:peptidoglycan-N-acetylglucosamine deacetylase
MKLLLSSVATFAFAAFAVSGAVIAQDAAPAEAPAAASAAPGCAGNDKALGVGRTVQIDTTGGPGFGFEHYKVHDFLLDKEVVLTFDDGPQVRTTKAILDALDRHCTKATFFSIGKMAIGLPHLIREVAKRGHTVGTHTWSHANLRKKKKDAAVEEIEKGLSGVTRALGKPTASFFRFPFLGDSTETLEYLAERNLAVFSTDIDSRDYKRQSPKKLAQYIMGKLDDKGKGILLLHDIHKRTAQAVPILLDALQAGGYKVVHLTAATTAPTLAQYDKMIEKNVKGLPGAGNERPTSSVVKTVPSP